MELTKHEILERKLTAVIMPALQQLINIRKNMIYSEVEAIKKRSLSDTSTYENLNTFYHKRHEDLSLIEQKHNWNELHPYDLPKLLHISLSFEIKREYGIYEINVPDLQYVTIEEGTEYDLNKLDETIKVKIKSWDFIWDIVSVVALNEELEKLQSDIEVAKAELNLMHEEIHPLPIDKTTGGAAITIVDTEENIIGNEVIEDDARIRDVIYSREDCERNLSDIFVSGEMFKGFKVYCDKLQGVQTKAGALFRDKVIHESNGLYEWKGIKLGAKYQAIESLGYFIHFLKIHDYLKQGYDNKAYANAFIPFFFARQKSIKGLAQEIKSNPKFAPYFTDLV